MDINQFLDGMENGGMFLIGNDNVEWENRVIERPATFLFKIDKFAIFQEEDGSLLFENDKGYVYTPGTVETAWGLIPIEVLDEPIKKQIYDRLKI